MKKAVIVIDMPKRCKDCFRYRADAWFGGRCTQVKEDDGWDKKIEADEEYNVQNWCPLQIVGKYYPKESEIDWRKEFEDMVRYIGVIDYGKERWFMETEKSGRVRWYDRYDGEYLTTDELQHRIYEVVRKLDD